MKINFPFFKKTITYQSINSAYRNMQDVMTSHRYQLPPHEEYLSRVNRETSHANIFSKLCKTLKIIFHHK